MPRVGRAGIWRGTTLPSSPCRTIGRWLGWSCPPAERKGLCPVGQRPAPQHPERFLQWLHPHAGDRDRDAHAGQPDRARRDRFARQPLGGCGRTGRCDRHLWRNDAGRVSLGGAARGSLSLAVCGRDVLVVLCGAIVGRFRDDPVGRWLGRALRGRSRVTRSLAHDAGSPRCPWRTPMCAGSPSSGQMDGGIWSSPTSGRRPSAIVPASSVLTIASWSPEWRAARRSAGDRSRRSSLVRLRGLTCGYARQPFGPRH